MNNESKINNIIDLKELVDYMREKDLEIEHWRYKHLKEFKSRKRCEERIDKAMSYYLKELSQCSHIDDVAVEMFNLLEGNKWLNQ